MTTITASDVAALRKQTGAGMMDCKKALEEAGGDMDKAVEILRVKMGNKLGKLADREAGEGTVQATSTPTARSACSSRSTATPTSSPATRTSSRSPARSRCTSPRPQTR